MRRRSFIHYNALVGVGLSSGVVNLFYHPSFKAWKYAGFDNAVIDNFNDLADQIFSNLNDREAAAKMATNLFTPSEIIKFNSGNSIKEIIFKNLCGDFVAYTSDQKSFRIRFLKQLPV